MKKLLLSLTLLCIGFVQGQNLFSFGFDGATADMVTAGWQLTNQSTPIYTGAPTWSIPSTAPTSTFTSGGQAGGATSFALINYTSTGTSATAGSGTISNWMISPVINVQNGDVVSFYTTYGGTAAQESYADNMQLLMSTHGASSVIPSTGAADVGDFTNNLVEINPTLNPTGYPVGWTQYTYTISGLSAATDCMFAFRYYVTDGGPGGTNSDIIGVDTFSVDRPLASTQTFFANNFSIQPNPVKDIFTVTSKNGTFINNIKVTDINGRIVKEENNSDLNATQVNISDLSSGVYFVKIQSDLGVGTTKIIKE